MLNNIFTLMDKFGFGTQKRALNIRFSNVEHSAQVILQRIEGFHTINEGLLAGLICLFF